MTTGHHYQSVCYRCSFRAQGLISRCPVCQFALILEAETTPPGGRRIEEILNRSSVRTGAPPLPGVDAGKRKAQLMAEARRRRQTERRDGDSQPAIPVAAPAAVAERVQTWFAVKLGLLCASAVAAGVLAAFLHRSM